MTTRPNIVQALSHVSVVLEDADAKTTATVSYPSALVLDLMRIDSLVIMESSGKQLGALSNTENLKAYCRLLDAGLVTGPDFDQINNWPAFAKLPSDQQRVELTLIGWQVLKAVERLTSLTGQTVKTRLLAED